MNESVKLVVSIHKNYFDSLKHVINMLVFSLVNELPLKMVIFFVTAFQGSNFLKAVFFFRV